MTREDIIGKVMSNARNKAGISQYEMARRMKKSRATVANWESGYSIPNIVDFFKWFEVVGTSPGPAFYAVLNPSLYESLTAIEAQKNAVEVLKNEINTLTEKEAKGVMYILHAYHGGDRYSVIQETVANLQCPLKCRQSVCNTIIHNYEDALETGELTNPDLVQPDIEALKEAYRKGRQASKQGMNGYI